MKSPGPATLVLLLAALPLAARDGDVLNLAPLARMSHGLPRRIVLDPGSGGRYAVLALDTGIEILDLLASGGAAPIAELYLPAPAFDVAIQGRLAYVAAGDAGLIIIDLTDPAAPVRRGEVRSLGARGVAVSGRYAYLAEAADPPAVSNGLRVIDVLVADAPVSAAFAPLAWGPRDVILIGDRAWLGAGWSGAGPHALVPVDVRDPLAPAPLGPLPLSRPAHELLAQGLDLFVATGYPADGELLVVDADPSRAPSIQARVALGDAALGLGLSGNVLGVAARGLGLVLLDVSLPAAPERKGTAFTGREAVAAALAPGTAWVAERSSSGQAAFRTLLTVDPLRPQVVSTLGYAEATDAAGAGGVAYLLYRDGLDLYDTGNFSLPRFLGRHAPPLADFTALDVEGPLAAVAEGAQVQLLDVGNPTSPAPLGRIDVDSGIAIRPVLEGDRAYVVTGRGVESFDITSRTTPIPLGSFPTTGLSAALDVLGFSGYVVAGDTLETLDLLPANPLPLGSLSISGEQLHGVAVDPVRMLAVVTGSSRLFYVVDVRDPGMLLGVSSGPPGAGFGVKLIEDRAVIAAGEQGVLIFDLSTAATPRLEASQDTSGTLYALGSDGNALLLATQAAQHWLTICQTCKGGCVEVWPEIDPYSLRMGQVGSSYEYRWVLDRGCCASNVALTTSKVRLPDLWMDPPVGSSPTGSFTDAVPPPPPGQVGYHRVFGRNSCTGASVQP